MDSCSQAFSPGLAFSLPSLSSGEPQYETSAIHATAGAGVLFGTRVMHTEVQAATRPAITLAEQEADALADLALRSMNPSSLGAKLLLEEVNRANTLSASELPADVVTMNSRVVFEDETTGESHSVQLVYPKDADMEAHRLSVLSPMGAGLIGMQQGGSIEWPNRQGVLRRLKIVEVVQPPRD